MFNTMETTAHYTTELDNDNTSTQQYFSFIVDGQEYAVDILRVQEIRGWTGVRHMPTLPSYIKGVIDLRGGIVPIIDLRERFGMPVLKYTSLTVVVILNIIGSTGEKMVGLVVDAVSDVIDIENEQLKPPPDFGTDIETDFVNHLATVNDKMIILLNIDKLLGADMPKHIPTRADIAAGPAAEPPGSRSATKHEAPHEATDTAVPESSLKADDDSDAAEAAFSEAQIEMLERSFKLLAPDALELVSHFYSTLFKRHPDVKPLFAHTDVQEQKKKLIAALQLVINNLRHPEKLGKALAELGKKHQQYGALPAHYDAVAGTLLEVMSEMAGESWSREIEDAWQAALLAVKQGMLAGYD